MVEDVGKKIVKGAGFIFMFSVLASIAGYLLRFVLSRNLSVTDFGLFYAVFSFIVFFSLFKDLGLTSALVKFVAEFNAKKQFHKIKSSFVYVLGAQLISIAIFALIVFLIKDFLIYDYFGDSRAGTLLPLLLGWLFVSAFQDSIFFLFYGLHNFFVFAMREFLKNVLPLIILFIYLFTGFDYKSPAISYLLAVILTSVVMYIYLLRKLNFSKYKIVKSMSFAKKLFSFGLPMLLSTAGYSIISYMDTIILTFFRPLEDVGVYNVVIPTALLFLIFGRTLSRVIFPISSELWAKKKKKELRIYIQKMYKYVFLLTLPFIMVLFVFSDLFLRFFFGPAYEIGAVPLKILLVGILVYSLATINNNTIAGIGKPEVITKIVLIGALVNLVLNFVLIPKFGIFGAAIGTSISYIVIFVLGFIKISKIVSPKFPIMDWSKTFFAGLIFLFLTLALRSWISINPWLELILFSAISFLIYIVIILLFKVTSIKEIFELVNTFIKQ